MDFKDLKELLEDRHLTIGSIESFTGGEFADMMTRVPGASHVYKGSVITYWTEIKHKVLNIPQDIIDEYGVVSHEVAKEMAYRGRDLLDVDICVSFTGNAGPSAMENKPVGLIYIGIATKSKVKSYEYQLNGSRDEIRNQAIENFFSLIREELN